MLKFFVGCFSVLLIGPSVLTAAWRLDYDVAETRTAPPNAPPARAGKVEKKAYVLRVWLEKDAMVIEREQTMTWWNFAERTVTTFQRERRQLDQTNLLATLGFREAEFQNRLHLGEALKAAGVKEAVFDVVLMEHLFCRRAPQSPGPELTANGGFVRWTHAGKTLFVVEQNGAEWSPEQRRVWLRFVVYLFGLHPVIVADLEKRPAWPSEMEIGRFNSDAEQLVFRLRGVAEEVAPSVPASAVGEPPQAEAVKIAAQVEQLGAEGYRAACAALHEDFEASFRNGRVLEGALLMLEWGLWTDALTPEVVRSHRDAMNHDADCQALLTSLNPRSKAETEQAVATLLQLENRSGKGKRALRIFRANNLTKLGKYQESRQIFVEVLSEAPANVGALKDLGDLYYAAFEMPDAWRCWDAKRLLSTHKNLKPVLEMEQRLIAENAKLL